MKITILGRYIKIPDFFLYNTNFRNGSKMQTGQNALHCEV